MGKGMYRGIGGVARKITKRYIGIGGVARNVKARYRGIGGVARQTFASDLYLIKDGEYQVDFTTTAVWESYGMGKNYKVTEGEGYIELYNDDTGMAALITEDGIDLSQYSKINIECEVSMYTPLSSAYNRAAIGAYDSTEEALGTGNPWTPGDGTIFYKDFYSAKGSAIDFVEVSKSYDISDYTDVGHVFVYGTSYNLSGDYSYIRIKNLWLE